MIQIMKKYPDASVLAFTEAITLRLAFAMPFVKNRIVLSLRNDPVATPVQRLYRRIRDHAFNKADACIFQTADARDYFSSSMRLKSAIIPNPINPDLPEMYEGPRDKTIVAVGRLSEQKNFSMLIDAFSKLHVDYPEYKLIFFGRGELEEKLKKQAMDLQISDFVVLY